uniref:Uncharacterized protein n=1 Tax=Anopheles triannulatus TaxID=58253 RepID=A0A2M4AYG8_9DIPT
MAEIEAIITRQGAVHTLKETVTVGDMKDLISSLKNIKGSTNELLTTFVQEDTSKPGARATNPRDGDEECDEEDSDEPDASEGTPQKRVKT